MKSLLKLSSALVLASIGAAAASCSDDDGANVQPNGAIPNMGGAAGSGIGGDAGSGGSDAGSGGMGGGTSGSGGALGGSGGSAGCTPLAVDAGTSDAGDVDSGIGDASSDGSASGVVSFTSDIHPIFVAHCGPCHVDLNSGGHNVGDPNVDDAYDDAVRFSADVLIRTNGQGMPPAFADPPNNCAEGDGPGDPGCLSVAEYALIQTWVDQCYPR